MVVPTVLAMTARRSCVACSCSDSWAALSAMLLPPWDRCGTTICMRKWQEGSRMQRIGRRQFIATTTLGSGALGSGVSAPALRARAQDMAAHERELYEAAKREG